MKAMATSPCAKCPFKDGDWLREDRRREISEALKHDQTFFCHSTVEYETEVEDEGESVGLVTSDSRECVGAHILSVRSGFAVQYHRNLERLGVMPEDEDFKGDSIPWRDLDDWVLQGGEPEEIEPCSYAGPNCEAPAGWLNSNGSISYGDVSADLECQGCYEPVCGSCVNDDGFCGYCEESEDDW